MLYGVIDIGFQHDSPHDLSGGQRSHPPGFEQQVRGRARRIYHAQGEDEQGWYPKGGRGPYGAADGHGADHAGRGVSPFGTAALRNITNTQEVLDAIQAQSGFQVQVLSGEEETEFDYYGALQSTPLDGGLLVDVGGGSWNFVYFTKRRAVLGGLVAHRLADTLQPLRGWNPAQPGRGTEDRGGGRRPDRGRPAAHPAAAPPSRSWRWAARPAAQKLRNSLEGKSGNSAYDTSFLWGFPLPDGDGP